MAMLAWRVLLTPVWPALMDIKKTISVPRKHRHMLADRGQANLFGLQ